MNDEPADALWAFIQEHQFCGERDGGVEADRVCMTCARDAVTTGTRIGTYQRLAAAPSWRVVAFG